MDAPSPIHPWVAAADDGVRFGIETVAAAPWPVLRSFADTVERLGFDSLWLSDHPQVAGSATWTHLAALAATTRRVRLGPLVACASYLNPVLMARAVADLDAISGGRAVLGLGSGNLAPEFARLGLPWGTAADRLATLAAALDIVVPLLRGEVVTRASGPFRPEGAALVPPPDQVPRIPVLVGGGGERTTLPLTARYADASNFGPASPATDTTDPEVIRRKQTVLDGLLAGAGRPPATVLRTALVGAFLGLDPAATRARAAALSPAPAALLAQLPFIHDTDELTRRLRGMVAAGIRYVIVIVLPGDEETLALLAERVVPEVT